MSAIPRKTNANRLSLLVFSRSCTSRCEPSPTGHSSGGSNSSGGVHFCVVPTFFIFSLLDLEAKKTNYSYTSMHTSTLVLREYHHKCTNKHAAGTRTQSTLSTMLLNYDQSFLETDLYSSLKCVMHKLLECTNSSSASEVRTFSCAKSSTL